jgi:hypothetical protein
MIRRALVLLSLAITTGEAAAAPPGATPPAPEPEVGHRYLALGAALGTCNQLAGHPGQTGGCGSFEVFAGWAFSGWAVLGWGRLRIAGDDTGFGDLGLAARRWFPDLPRVYAELRAGYEYFEIAHWEYDFAGQPEREGAIIGAGLGLELLTSPVVTIDARGTIDRGITADTDDYTLISFALAFHIY